jgi:integrase
LTQHTATCYGPRIPTEGAHSTSIRTRKWTTRKGEKREAYVVDYYDKAGKRHIETFDKLKDAKARQNEIGVEIKDGVHVPRSTSITVGEACDLWVEDRKAYRDPDSGRSLEPTSIAGYEQHVRLHIKPRIGTIKLADFTGPHFKAFTTRLIQDKNAVSPAMTKKVANSLTMALGFAFEAGYINRNIAASKRAKKGNGRHKTRPEIGIDIPTPAEIQAFLKVLHNDEDKLAKDWRAFFVLAINSGMRASELRGLRWKNVKLDKDRGVIQVRERADIHHQLGSPKSESSERDIPIGASVVKALKEHKLKTANTADDALVFPTREAKKGDNKRVGGGVQPHANIRQRALIPLWIKAGVTAPKLDGNDKPVVDKDGAPVLTAKYTGLHSFRHYFASWLLNPPARGGLGKTIMEAKTLLGHGTTAMTTDTYGHLLPQDVHAVLGGAEIALASDTRAT